MASLEETLWEKVKVFREDINKQEPLTHTQAVMLKQLGPVTVRQAVNEWLAEFEYEYKGRIAARTISEE